MWVFEDAWMVNPHLPITHTRKRCSRSQAQALAPPPRRRHRRAHGPPQAALNDHHGPPPLRFRREVCGQGGPLVSLGNTCWYTTIGYVRRFQMAPRNSGSTELDLAAGGAGKMPESAAFSALGLLIIIGSPLMPGKSWLFCLDVASCCFVLVGLCVGAAPGRPPRGRDGPLSNKFA